MYIYIYTTYEIAFNWSVDIFRASEGGVLQVIVGTAVAKRDLFCKNSFNVLDFGL